MCRVRKANTGRTTCHACQVNGLPRPGDLPAQVCSWQRGGVLCGRLAARFSTAGTKRKQHWYCDAHCCTVCKQAKAHNGRTKCNSCSRRKRPREEEEEEGEEPPAKRPRKEPALPADADIGPCCWKPDQRGVNPVPCGRRALDNIRKATGGAWYCTEHACDDCGQRKATNGARKCESCSKGIRSVRLVGGVPGPCTWMPDRRGAVIDSPPCAKLGIAQVRTGPAVGAWYCAEHTCTVCGECKAHNGFAVCHRCKASGMYKT